jgi:methionine aminopeptidase
MTKLNFGMLELNRILTDTVEDSLHIDLDYIADSNTVYQTTPSKQSKLIEVVRQANEKGIKGIHIVSQSDLINEDIYTRSAKGFVRNGEIYINVDRAGDDTVIHEFGHLYLADAKNNNRLAYYKLLDKIKDTTL